MRPVEADRYAASTNEPVSKFVAGFVGSPSIHFVPATLFVEERKPTLRFTDNRQIILPPSRLDALSNHIDKSVICGIRPEHIGRADDADLKIEIEFMQPTGSRTYATFQLSGVPVVAELDAQDVAQVSEQMNVSIDTRCMLLIDPVTDKVL